VPNCAQAALIMAIVSAGDSTGTPLETQGRSIVGRPPASRVSVDERFSGHWKGFTVTTLTLRDMRRMRLRVFSSLLLRGRFPWKGSSSAAELLYLTPTAQRTGARLVAEISFNTGLSAHAFLESHLDVRVVTSLPPG
jgi:hypothetical protein